MTVALGDEIITGAGGRVQMLFADDTRIAVGARSRLVIEDVLFDSSAGSSNFVVEAVSGAFRFLSGRSSDDSYSVRTPTATMGIRGTTFDFTVMSERGVDLATLEGEVLLCNMDGRCARVSGSCAAVTLSGSGNFMVPQNRAEKRALLRNQFPFIVDQGWLRRDFLAPVQACGRLAIFQQGGDGSAPSTPAPETPAPEAPDRDGTGGAQAGGGAASSGGGGSTAGGTSAGAGGPASGPGDADAGGGGASAGGASAGGGAASAGGN